MVMARAGTCWHAESALLRLCVWAQNPHAYQNEQQVEYLNGAAAPATLHLLAYESKHPCEFLITLSAAPPAANELPENE